MSDDTKPLTERERKDSQSGRMTDQNISAEQVWVERKSGRRLRVTVHCYNRIAVRNCETGRLSYLPIRRFRDGSLILEETL